MKKLIVILMALIAYSTQALADKVSFTASAPDVVVVGDQFRLSYTVTTQKVKDFQAPSIKGFDVLMGPSRSQQNIESFDMSIEMHDEYQIGWYLFELMIGKDMWSRVHGVVYPDGTVRDPSIVAAIGGFFRNRSETAIRSDVNQEDYVKRVSILAERTLHAARQNQGSDHSQDVENLLEVCEYAANLLEAGELVPMAYPPTAKIAAYRRQQNVDAMEIEDYLTELMGTLKKACHIIE